MTIWRRVVAFLLPLWVLGCSSTGARVGLTHLPSEPNVTPNIKPDAGSSIEPNVNPNRESNASQGLARFNPVPPNGLDSLDESAFRYFRTMGPLEYAVRLGGIPDVPAWRVRLRLYPEQQGPELIYRVKMDHFNASPIVYEAIANSYGEENTDPRLNNRTPHQHINLEFFPVMNVAADWLSEATQISESDVTTMPTCGLGISCLTLDDPEDSEWIDSATVPVDISPWNSDSDPLPTIVRTLAQQAGWIDEDGWWTLPPEIPEGISDEHPWVEVLITNYAGNGGGYVAHWIERGADDSVLATVHRVHYHPMDPNSLASQGYICGRGEVKGQIRAICP